MEVKNIAMKLFIGTGEGPHYDLASDELYLVDIPDISKDGHGRLFRKKYSDPNAEFEIHDMGVNYTSFIVPTTKDKFLVGLNQTIAEVDWPRNGDSASHTIMHSVEEGKPTRFNDAKCDHRGRLWAGTMSLEKAPGVVHSPEIGALYGVNTDRTIKHLPENYTLSNGLAWTADEKQFFFIDSVMKKIFVYDYDPENFTATNRRVFYDIEEKNEVGLPDGCCMDTDNRLWVAMYAGSNVLCIDTTTGQKCNTIKIPAERVTSCCFGGPNLDEMIVTTSTASAAPSDVEAGSLYRVRNTGARGPPMVKFDG